MVFSIFVNKMRSFANYQSSLPTPVCPNQFVAVFRPDLFNQLTQIVSPRVSRHSFQIVPSNLNFDCQAARYGAAPTDTNTRYGVVRSYTKPSTIICFDGFAAAFAI
jgi:hypothetical protein